MLNLAQIMHAVLALSAGAAGTLAGSLIAAIWQGIVLVAAVALCLRLLPGIPAAVRSVIWTFVLFLVVFLHFTPLFGPFFARNAAETGAFGAFFHHSAALHHSAFFHFDPRWSFAIAAIWLAFSLLRAVRLAASAFTLNKVVRRAVPVAELPAALDSSLLDCGYRTAKLCVSKEIDRPSVAGYFWPKILLPTDSLARISDAELLQIVLHETEHLRRNDDWTNLIQKLSLVLFPLNPALLWVERRLCMEREMACDDRVLEATGNRKGYATCLTNLAENAMVRRGAMLVLGAWERQSELARRVYRILRGSERRMGARRLRLVTGGMAVMLLAGTAELSRSPELVSFAGNAPVQSAALQSAAVQGAAVMGNSRAMMVPVVARMASARRVGGILAAVRRGGAMGSLGNGMATAKLLNPQMHEAGPQVRETMVSAVLPDGVTSAHVAVTGQVAAQTRIVAGNANIDSGNKERAGQLGPGQLRQGLRRRQVRDEDGSGENWLVLTSGNEDAPPRIRFAISQETGKSYAAVQVENGWIVFQL